MNGRTLEDSGSLLEDPAERLFVEALGGMLFVSRGVVNGVVS
jgi:hypothetical protein